MNKVSKNLNKKGFTLIELLAVMVILLAISTLTISSISAAIERNKEINNKAKISVIESYAKLYFDDTGKKCINLSELKLTEEESLDAYGDKFVGVVRINEYNIPVFDNTYSSCS